MTLAVDERHFLVRHILGRSQDIHLQARFCDNHFSDDIVSLAEESVPVIQGLERCLVKVIPFWYTVLKL